MSIKYTCNGPLRSVKESELSALLEELGDKLTKTQRERLSDRESGEIANIGPLQHKGKSIVLIRTPNGPSVRAYCGRDVTAEIEAVPEDGEVHGATCPTCGNVTSVRKAVPSLG